MQEHRNIGLYGFNYVGAIANGSSNVLNNSFYIDSFGPRNKEVEKCIGQGEKSAWRLLWYPIEASNGRLDNAVVSAALPNADKALVNAIGEEIMKLGHIQIQSVEEIIYMSQRTHLCKLSPIDLLYQINQVFRFFIAYLRQTQIDIVVSTEIPHHVTDYIFCIACREMGIPFITQINQGLTHSCFYVDFLSSRFIVNEQGFGGNKISKLGIKAYLSKHSQRNIEDWNDNSYVSYDKSTRELYNITESNIRKFLTSGSDNSVQIIEALYKNTKAYDYLSEKKPIPEDINGTVHYFFANFQPEATTSPMCGIWADARVCLNELVKLIDKDDIVVYREHPTQFKFLPLMEGDKEHIENVYSIKSPKYYTTITAMDKVYLAKRGARAQNIFNQDKVKIWSPYGTVSLEAFLANKRFGFFDTMSPWAGLKEISEKNSMNSMERFVRAETYINELSWPMIISDLYLFTQNTYRESMMHEATYLGDFIVNLVSAAKNQ